MQIGDRVEVSKVCDFDVMFAGGKEFPVGSTGTIREFNEDGFALAQFDHKYRVNEGGLIAITTDENPADPSLVIVRLLDEAN